MDLGASHEGEKYQAQKLLTLHCLPVLLLVAVLAWVEGLMGLMRGLVKQLSRIKRSEKRKRPRKLPSERKVLIQRLVQASKAPRKHREQ
jgi:hypothetical protein